MFRLTRESMNLLIEELIDRYESSNDIDTQYERMRQVLIDNGIEEIQEETMLRS